MQVKILGCGGSQGVPAIGGDWGTCDPAEPKNRRLRPSILIEWHGVNILIDTSPDLKNQLLSDKQHNQYLLLSFCYDKEVLVI